MMYKSSRFHNRCTNKKVLKGRQSHNHDIFPIYYNQPVLSSIKYRANSHGFRSFETCNDSKSHGQTWYTPDVESSIYSIHMGRGGKAKTCKNNRNRQTLESNTYFFGLSDIDINTPDAI